MVKEKAVLLFSLDTQKFDACIPGDNRVAQSGTTINGEYWYSPYGKHEIGETITPQIFSEIIKEWKNKKRGYSWVILGVFGRPFIIDTAKIVKATALFAEVLITTK